MTVENEAVRTHRKRFDYWRRSVLAAKRHPEDRAWRLQLHRSLNNMFQFYRDLLFAKIGVELEF
ncbi:MAG TPA: hypothetical protein VJQ82_17970 [Terriglobales bacterium]|nr:hypothetical protein [Terriglobales bacterium]